jgi:hypothetical protein
VVLEKKPYIVPALCGGVVPLFAGETLPFTLVK